MITTGAPLAKSKSQSLTCPACNGPAEVRSRHVAIDGKTVRVYCSAECLRAKAPPTSELVALAIDEGPHRRWRWWLTGGFALGATCLAILYASASDGAEDPGAVWLPPPMPAVAVEPPREPAPAPAPAEPDPREAEEQALLEELARDAWIHPLAGPKRRMPINHFGAFGAARAGERPPECLSGHCGVDIGRVWGEPVHAVHGGVVEWVNRGPNEAHGGIFVKLAHRGGTLFSWYFHLSAVPRWVKRGAKVKVGQVIGLIGDTGVKRPVPHLHFSLSVKSPKRRRERFLDPEPLIAIWPLWLPESADRGKLSLATAPGVPVREHRRRKPKPKPARKPAPATAPVTTPDPAPALEASPVGAPVSPPVSAPVSAPIEPPATSPPAP